jgi:hypothetical protein
MVAGEAQCFRRLNTLINMRNTGVLKGTLHYLSAGL